VYLLATKYYIVIRCFNGSTCIQSFTLTRDDSGLHFLEEGTCGNLDGQVEVTAIESSRKDHSAQSGPKPGLLARLGCSGFNNNMI
jgi:hypothetical protein